MWENKSNYLQKVKENINKNNIKGSLTMKKRIIKKMSKTPS